VKKKKGRKLGGEEIKKTRGVEGQGRQNSLDTQSKKRTIGGGGEKKMLGGGSGKRERG